MLEKDGVFIGFRVDASQAALACSWTRLCAISFLLF